MCRPPQFTGKPGRRMMRNRAIVTLVDTEYLRPYLSGFYNVTPPQTVDVMIEQSLHIRVCFQIQRLLQQCEKEPHQTKQYTLSKLKDSPGVDTDENTALCDNNNPVKVFSLSQHTQ